MDDSVQRRVATLDDVEWLFDLHRTVFRCHIEEIWGWNEAWQRSQFRSEFESSLTSVIHVAGRAVGYLQTTVAATGLNLRNIALHPDAQGRGIGAHLVRQVQQEAVERGVPVTLSVFRTNHRAADFYERLGFRKTRQTEAFVEMIWQLA